MPKNLLVFSDGTGNAGGKSRDTNVYRLYNSIDRGRGPGDETEQRTHYDDGVGTSDNAVVKAITGAFGMGLSRNIRQLYAWLIENYEVGDRIYIFGFSRGAFTARCLAGMVKRCGLLKKEVYQGLDVKERDRRLRRELKAYRAAWEFAFKYWHPAAEAPDYHQPRIHFVGVWDTVDAVGMPVDELRPIFDHAWRFLTLRRMYGFSDRVLAGVDHARHAVALDDERRTFHPNVWYKHPNGDARTSEGDDPKRLTDSLQIKQVWFAGVHANVGGGYPKDHLAMVALDWMMGELENLPDHPVRFNKGARRRYQEHSNAEGQKYNPRSGPAAYYRYSPRRITRFYKGTDDIWKRWWRILFRRPSADLPSGGIAVHASVF